jgi:hypothetical protein
MMLGLPWCLGVLARKLLRSFRGELQCLARRVGQFHTYPSARLCLFNFPAVLSTFRLNASSFCVESTFSIATPQGRKFLAEPSGLARSQSTPPNERERQGQLGRGLPPYLLNKAHRLTTDDVGPHFPLPMRSIPFPMTKQALARSRKRISCSTSARCTRVPAITM